MTYLCSLLMVELPSIDLRNGSFRQATYTEVSPREDRILAERAVKTSTRFTWHLVIISAGEERGYIILHASSQPKKKKQKQKTSGTSNY